MPLLKHLSAIAVPALTILLAAPAQAEPQRLDDAALADITAKGVGEDAPSSLPQASNRFSFEKQTSRFNITGNGSLDVLANAPSPARQSYELTQIGSVELSGQAQQQLRSLVNVNAANSAVQVLMNLNIAIDSVTGDIVQDNQAALR